MSVLRHVVMLKWDNEIVAARSTTTSRTAITRPTKRSPFAI